MGTEIQAKLYAPLYYCTRDLNDNAGNGILALNHGDKSLKNGMWFNSVLTRSGIDGCFGYEKEQFRQTILKHESTFRHQLQELHRLYKRQRDLMNEIKRKELLKLPMPVETSRTYIPSENAKISWNVSNVPPFLDSTFGRPTRLCSGSFQSPPNFTKGNHMSSSFPSQYQVISKDGRFLESKCDMLHKRMFPDSLYLKNDEKQPNERVFGLSGMIGNTLNGHREFTRERDLNYSVGDGDGSRGNLYIKRTPGLVDLNEPIEVHDVSILASSGNSDNITCLDEEEKKRLDIPANTNSGSRVLSKECPQSSIVISNGGIYLNNLPSEYGRAQKEQFTCNSQAGLTKCDPVSFHRVVSSEDSNSPFKSSQFEPRKVDAPLTLPQSDQSKTEPRRTRKIFGVEIFEEIHDQSIAENGIRLGSHSDAKQLKICFSPCGFNFGSDVKAKTSAPELSVPHVPVESFEASNSVDVKFEKVNTNMAPPHKVQDQVIPRQKILGIPIFDMSQTSKDLPSPSAASKSASLTSAVDGDSTMKDLACDHNSGDQVELGDRISGLSCHIDLNLCFYEEEAPLAPSLPTTVVKIAATEIDLEAPAVLESEMNSEKIEIKEPCEDPVLVAAEAIIAISSSNHPLEDSPVDSLLWFADIIFSHNGDLEADMRAVSGESAPAGMDYFEFMTLMLTETKAEACCYNPSDSENQKDTETDPTFLAKRPQRGQARRGRQKKDFQKDVLPGIVSLTRHEVTRDLQTIEELFRASGCTWQSSLSQRNAAKNSRGRRRLGAATVICQPPLQQPPIYREVGLDEKSLTGWGKRTRRLPRQRCPADNNPLIALKC